MANCVPEAAVLLAWNMATRPAPASLGARFEAINREPQYGQSIWWPVSGSGNQAGTGLNSPAKSDSFPATSRPLPTTPLDFRLRPWFASWHYDGG